MNNHRFFRPFSQSNQPSLSAATKNFVSFDVKINHDKVLSEAPKQFSQNFVHFATFRNPTLMQSHTIAIKNLSCLSCLSMLKKNTIVKPKPAASVVVFVVVVFKCFRTFAQQKTINSHSTNQPTTPHFQRNKADIVSHLSAAGAAKFIDTLKHVAFNI